MISTPTGVSLTNRGESGSKKNDLFNGIRLLNFIVILDRQLYMDAFFNHLARSQGMLVLRDGFSLLEVNDTPAEVYYMVESPAPELLEVSGRPQSAVFRKRDTAFEYTVFFDKSLEQLGDSQSSEFYKEHINNKERESAYRAALDSLLRAETIEDLRPLLNIERTASSMPFPWSPARDILSRRTTSSGITTTQPGSSSRSHGISVSKPSPRRYQKDSSWGRGTGIARQPNGSSPEMLRTASSGTGSSGTGSTTM